MSNTGTRSLQLRVVGERAHVPLVVAVTHAQRRRAEAGAELGLQASPARAALEVETAHVILQAGFHAHHLAMHPASLQLRGTSAQPRAHARAPGNYLGWRLRVCALAAAFSPLPSLNTFKDPFLMCELEVRTGANVFSNIVFHYYAVCVLIPLLKYIRN